MAVNASRGAQALAGAVGHVQGVRVRAKVRLRLAIMSMKRPPPPRCKTTCSCTKSRSPGISGGLPSSDISVRFHCSQAEAEPSASIRQLPELRYPRITVFISSERRQRHAGSSMLMRHGGKPDVSQQCRVLALHPTSACCPYCTSMRRYASLLTTWGCLDISEMSSCLENCTNFRVQMALTTYKAVHCALYIAREHKTHSLVAVEDHLDRPSHAQVDQVLQRSCQLI